jgi:hypothetical protein
MVVVRHRWMRYLVLAGVIAVHCSSSNPTGLNPFASRTGAVDPVAASQKPFETSYKHVELAAGAANVTVRFVNAVPQSVTVLDEATGSDLYHVSSRFGPGNPKLDQGFVQLFLAPLHGDGSDQLVLAYGDCQPACTGASQVLVISMNAEHGVAIEQLKLDSLKSAVVEARGDGLWITQWSGDQLVSTRHFGWDLAAQAFVER